MDQKNNLAAENTLGQINSFQKLDLKDYKILRELDINFRESFSKIGKKVGLSKNSVSLRFEKLKPFMLHNLTGINNRLLGQIMVKVYYSFNFYNETIEEEIIREVKKHNTILWAARYFGTYDLVLGLFINNLEDLMGALTKFDERFAEHIDEKEIQIISKEYRFRYNFIHKEPINKIYEISSEKEALILKNTEKKILMILRHNPRISLVDIATATHLSPKTVSNNIRSLEKRGIIMGYFMTLDARKFNFDFFQLLIRVKNSKKLPEFESYLKSIKNINGLFKMMGSWDYELDLIYPNVAELQKQIEIMKEKFPNIIGKIEILSVGRRIITNRENFLR